MAVVIVLVNPLILPPTIKDIPTSDIARPNPIINAPSMANRASLIIKAVAWYLLAPRETAVSVTALSTPKDAVEDPQFVGRGFWVEADHPVSGKQTYPGAPVKIGERGWRIRRPAPRLGQHNREVLSGLGYSEPEIDEFKKASII